MQEKTLPKASTPEAEELRKARMRQAALKRHEDPIIRDAVIRNMRVTQLFAPRGKHTESAKEKNKLAHIGLQSRRRGVTNIEEYGKVRAEEISKRKSASALQSDRLKESQQKRWEGYITIYSHSEREMAWKDIYAWRDSVFERDRYTCQCCGKVGGTLNAHHIKPWSLFPSL